MKKVLLTGAAGSIGYETLRQLVEAGYEVSVLELETKKAKKRLRKYQDKITIFYGSINDRDLVIKALDGVDVVLHLAAIIPPLADAEPDLTRNVNFFGTKNLVDVILEKKLNCFLVYTSSVSVYGDRVENPWIEVGDAMNPSEGDYYAYTKIETEAMIQESGISYTIFRLTGIMGRPDTDPLMFHMPLETKIEIATTQDTARALVRSVEKVKELNHHIYNLGGGEACRTTYYDFLKNMFAIYGLNVKFLREEAFADQNFHCGYYLDSDKLNAILDFQRDSLDTYYERVKKETPKMTRFFARIFSRPILYSLTKKSEPLQAKKKKDSNLISRFFKKF